MKWEKGLVLKPILGGPQTGVGLDLRLDHPTSLFWEHSQNPLMSLASGEEVRESGRSFESLIVWGEKLYILASRGCLKRENSGDFCNAYRLQDKDIYRYIGFTFQTFGSVSFLFFLGTFQFNCPRKPVIRVHALLISCYKPMHTYKLIVM